MRDEQAGETSTRILEATVRVMARGIADISVPAVALEAGVSVPTVYRHFGTKRDLLAAVYPYLTRRAGLGELVPPQTINELRDGVSVFFAHLDALSSAADELAIAALASPGAEEARRSSMPGRVALGQRLASSVIPELGRRDRDRIARLLTVLLTSSAWRVWRDYLGSSVDEAADDIDWTVRALIAAARTEGGA